MSIKDKFTLIISILALVISGVSLYYSNFEKANINFIVGKNGQVWQNNDKTISLFLPITFTNNSNSVGYVYGAKVKFYPKKSKLDNTFLWNEFWEKVPERDSIGDVFLINRPASDADIITFIGKSQEKKLINFWINTNKIRLEKGNYMVELLISTDLNNNWKKKTFEFQYSELIDISLNETSP